VKPLPAGPPDPAPVACAGRWREELPGTAARWLLLPAWCLYRPVVAARNLLYDVGALRVQRLPVPVVSVGNLTAGGTGKTPLVRHLVAWCRARGLAPAVLSRGYRGADGANDEALLIDGCPVVCDPDRAAGGRAAIAAGAGCLVLDDGFQHRRLHRDLDVVLIDATRPWGDARGGRGAVLPLGYLREGRGALRRAGLLALTRGEAVDAAALAQLERELRALGRPLVRVDEADPHLLPLGGGARAEVATLAGAAVVLASGLGNPLGFERAARRHGWRVAASLRFPDHHRYTAADAGTLAERARAAGAVLVVTAKDAVKLAERWPAGAPPAWVLRVESVVRAEDRAVLDAALDAALRPRTG
jgi:tetraacyldisaccharide 4'-kinase